MDRSTDWDRVLWMATMRGADSNALANGWRLDGDEWLYRAVKPAGAFIQDRPAADFAHSENAFIGDENDVADQVEPGAYLVCRNGFQAAILDYGGLV